jgi:hypothetical protein
MLAETPAGAPRSTTTAEQKRSAAWDRAGQGAVFTAAAAIVLVYSLRGGGSYDLITRQENGVVIWWIAAVGIALGLLPRRAPGGAATVAGGALLLFSIWAAISLGWTESAERTTDEIARSLDYLGLIVLIAFCLGRTNWRAAALGWATAAVVICGLAMASRLVPAAFPANNAGTVFGLSRLSYPFGYWNAVGAWASMTAALTLGWSAHDPRRLLRALSLAAVPLAVGTAYLTYSRAAFAGLAVGVVSVVALSRHRWTAVIHACISGAGSIAVIEVIRGQPQIARGTGTAGAITVVLVLIAVCAFAAVSGLGTLALSIDRWRLPRSAARGLSAVLAIAVIAAAAVTGPRLATKAWNGFRHPQVVTTANPAARLTSLSGYRYQLWKVALAAFNRQPLRGTGAGTFEFWWNRHATEPEFVRNAHSLWFENMAELGLPGLILIVTFALSVIAAGVSALRRSRRSSSAAACVAATAAFVVFLAQASVDWMWQSTAVTVLAIGGVAIVSSRSTGSRSKRGRASRAERASGTSVRRRGLPTTARLGLTLVAVAAGAIQIPGFLSQQEIHASQRAARAGNGPTALAWADNAVAAEPWAARPYLQRALVRESLGQFRPAAADVQRAISREATNFELWVILSRVETELGHQTAAIRDYRRAHQLRPFALVLK